jgi:hypothetical protein
MRAGTLPRTAIEIVPTASIPVRTWDEIWDLTQRYYDTERSYTEHKLRDRQRIALFRSCRDRSLVGMASLDLYPISFRGKGIVAIFTSHVLLREDYRGQNLIQRVGFQTFVRTRLRYPLRRCFWFFDTFSYKSYLLMARNFRHFWPRHDCPTPEWERGFIGHLGDHVYGDDWQPARGIVVRSGLKRLRPGTAPPDDKLIGDADFEFFTRSNPGHAEGDMLVCLCPLTARSWFGVAAKALARVR